jgi:hypothetical protein
MRQLCPIGLSIRGVRWGDAGEEGGQVEGRGRRQGLFAQGIGNLPAGADGVKRAGIHIEDAGHLAPARYVGAEGVHVHAAQHIHGGHLGPGSGCMRLFRVHGGFVAVLSEWLMVLSVANWTDPRATGAMEAKCQAVGNSYF